MMHIGKCEICRAYFRWDPAVNAYGCHPKYGSWCGACQEAVNRSIDNPTEEELSAQAQKRLDAFGVSQ